MGRHIVTVSIPAEDMQRVDDNCVNGQQVRIGIGGIDDGKGGGTNGVNNTVRGVPA